MGTSSIYNGPNDNPLLPDDFDEDSNDNTDTPEADNSDQPEYDNPFEKPWQTAKTSMSRHLTGSAPNRNGAVRNYINANGGATGFVKSSRAGISAGSRIGNLLTSIQRNGLAKTLSDFQIEMVGKSSEELLSELVNVLVDAPDTKEDSVAREATTIALVGIYDYLEENKISLQALETLDDSLVNNILSTYISAYIWGRISNDMQSRFEKYLNSSQEAIYKEADFKEYIKNCVDVELRKNSFKSRTSKTDSMNKVVQDLLQSCCEVLGGVI